MIKYLNSNKERAAILVHRCYFIPTSGLRDAFSGGYRSAKSEEGSGHRLCASEFIDLAEALKDIGSFFASAGM